ncbi:unnamed protein product [Parajaminaea phylloscopi]
MPPKGPAKGQPTLSSFFAKRPATQSSLDQAAPSSSVRERGDDAVSRTQEMAEPPAKKVRLTAPSSSTSGRSRVEQWRFDSHAKTPASHGDSEQENDLPPSSQKSQQDEDRHEEFKRRLLGSADPIRRRDQAARAAERQQQAGGDDEAGGSGGGSQSAGSDDDGDGNDTPAQQPSGALARFSHGGTSKSGRAPTQSKPGAKPAATSSSTVKYTPLELQVLELKAKHPDVLLLFEVGYKFIAYEEDAVNAAKELNVMCFPKQHMRIASIPVHRLHVHARRLIKAGYKVGVVRQTETRALKAASSNSSTPFTRELTELYTASTWVEDLETVGSSEASGDNPAAQNSLVAIVERLEGGVYGSDERVSIGLIAVQAATGAVVFDQFADSSMRSELETRLAHLHPAELLLPPEGKLSKPTEKLVRYLAGHSLGSSSARVRVERTGAVLSYQDAFAQVLGFYEQLGEDVKEAQQLGAEQDDGDGVGDMDDAAAAVLDDSTAGKTIATIMKLPHLAVIALATCVQHLQSFGLTSIFKTTSSFVSFQARSEMLLSAGTLYNLELFSTTEGTYKGSLCWLLDKCKTVFGKRLLRRWIARPLTDIDRLHHRSLAVSEFLSGKNHRLSKVPEILIQQPDLEKGLARMLYGRATPTEVATILLALNRICHQFADVTSPDQVDSDSSLLNESIAALPRAKDRVKQALADVNIAAARKGEKENMFTEDKYPELQDEKDQILVVEAELQEHLTELRKVLKRPTLQFATVSGIDYLVEVRVGDAKRVPADWLRMSATKSVVRFHTPVIIKLLKMRDQHKELLAAAANAAFARFVEAFCEDSIVLRNTIAALGTLDALIALASVAALPGYVRPTFVEGQGKIDIKGLRHPMSEILRDGDYVPNDVRLGEDGKAMVLTGANMGGKSSTVRAIALCVILGQIGSYVPATEATLSIHDAVLTRMGANDELARGRSTFMVEAEEAAEIMRTATSRSLVILDEIGRGTSTFDGQAIASAILTHLTTRELHRRPTLLFITHYTSLCALAARLDGVRNMHMAYVEQSEGQGSVRDKQVFFLYKLAEGPASSSFGIHCAALAGLPNKLLEGASQRAVALQEQTDRKMATKRAGAARGVLRRTFGRSVTPGDLAEIHAAAIRLGVPMESGSDADE